MKTSQVWGPTEELKEMVGADAEMMTELVTIFLDDSTSRLRKLHEACAARDLNVVRSQAHSLKGSARQMGAVALGNRCAELELSIDPRQEQCASIIMAIDDEFALIRCAMEGYLDQDETPAP